MHALLKRFKSQDDFLLRLVTVDETWVHYYKQNKKGSIMGNCYSADHIAEDHIHKT